jgi:acyl-coenzyme A thioesterase PaaI-like protein
MAPGKIIKKARHNMLIDLLKEKPFLTDEELASHFGVSIQTIRLDRLELGIPELRERTKIVAEEARGRLKSINAREIVGELVDLELGKSGISLMEITPDMTFEKSGIARGHHIFAQANSLALAVIDAPVALTGVANIKYKIPVEPGDKLIAKAEVVRQRGNKHFVWVRTKMGREEIFRAKFIMVAIEPKS